MLSLRDWVARREVVKRVGVGGRGLFRVGMRAVIFFLFIFLIIIITYDLYVSIINLYFAIYVDFNFSNLLLCFTNNKNNLGLYIFLKY